MISVKCRRYYFHRSRTTGATVFFYSPIQTLFASNMEFEETGIEEFSSRLIRNSRRSARLWMILAAITSVLAVVMTSLFIWHAVTYTQRNCSIQRANATAHEETRINRSVSLNIACPEFPTVVSLSHPLPSEIQHILDKLDSYLSARRRRGRVV